MNDEAYIPTVPDTKTMVFQIQPTEPMVECITLISQVMRSYKDLTHYEKAAIADWFCAAYGNKQ